VRSAKHFIPLDQVDHSLIWRERLKTNRSLKFPTAPRHEVCSILTHKNLHGLFIPEVTISGNGFLQYSLWKKHCQF